MSSNNAYGVRHVTRAEWATLREQCRRVLTDSAQVREEALHVRSQVVEARVRFAGGLRVRHKTRLDRHP